MENNIISLVLERSKRWFNTEQLKEVEAQLNQNIEVVKVLERMEESKGEPALVAINPTTFTFMDTAEESPKGRRSLCYDEAAWHSRKTFKPKASVEKMTNEIGGILLNEEDYRLLQALKKVDMKTSSWIATPDPIRELGGGLFMDRRYNQVFIYHNGVESYYEARGFRVKVDLPRAK